MKKVLLLALAILMNVSTVSASTQPNSHILYENVKTGYTVGYVVSKDTVLSSDMHMWNLPGALEGWYVAYDLENDSFYYLTQDAAQAYFEK
ncbi:MAG: hypothetical protein ACI3T9_02340 [Romboutsia timonensis]